MTLNEFVYSIAEKINRTEDYAFVETLKKDVDSKRAYFLKQEKRRIVNWENFQQTIGCLELVESSMIECCGIDVEDCDKVLRSKLELPQFVTVGVTPFSYVGDDAYKHPHTYSTPENIKNIVRIPILSKRPLYAISQNHLVLINPVSKMVEQITVKGVFANPDDIAKYECKDGGSCYDHDKDYPASSDLMEIIRKDIYQELGIVQPSIDRETTVDDGKTV